MTSNGWVFVYELSGSGFESSCSHSSITSNSIKVTHVFYDKNQGVSTKTCGWKNLRLSWRFKYLFWKKNRTASIQGCLYIIRSNKCDIFRDLVTFVQFKKREKHPWRSVIFSKVAGLLKVTLLQGCFSRF